LSKLHIEVKSRPTVEEIYLIALALEIAYSEIIGFLCEGLKLKPESEWDVTPKSKV
jgi:hypothetical protein